MMRKETILSLLILAMAVFFAVKLFVFNEVTEPEALDYAAKFKKDNKIYSVPIPAKLDFAGERVPLEHFDVRESLDRELHVNVYWQSQTMLFFKKASKFFPIIEPILKENGIPDDFKYLAVIESGLMGVVSPAGATGYWQFMKATGKEFGLEINSEVDERYHIEKSTEAACKYLKKSYKKYSNWTMVAAAYNAGNTGIAKQVKRQKQKAYYDLLLGDETGRYVFRILAVKEIMSNSSKYGFTFRSNDLYHLPEYKTVVLDSSVTNFANYAIHYKTNYKVLKNLNPWLRTTKLTNTSKKKYTIKIPVNRK